jgi:hypothetical protein
LLSPFLLQYGSSAKLPKQITMVVTVTTPNMKSTRKRRLILKRRKLMPKLMTSQPRTIPRTRIPRKRINQMTREVRMSLRTRTRHHHPMTKTSTSHQARTHLARLTKTLGKDLERPRKANESQPRRRAKRMYDLPCALRLLYRVVYCVL